MSGEGCSANIERIKILIVQINVMAAENKKLQPVFKSRSTPTLECTCYEAGFLRVVSWLYMLLYEAGRADIKFLLEKIGGFEKDSNGIYQTFYQLIHAIRTNFQHSMNFENQKYDALRQIAEAWFTEQILVPYPNTSLQWKKCLLALSKEALSFFEVMKRIVKIIISNEDAEQLILSWNQYASHFHEPSDFDQIIFTVAYELGIQIDVVRHRNKYYHTWSKLIEVLPSGYDFETEARKLIQKTLMEDPPIPLTTADIMKEFDIAPGPKVGHYLKQAKQLYFDSPCQKDQLIERLKTIQ